MNLPFLRYFKKGKPAEGGTVVAERPAASIEKPASERFGKTVMPNVTRIVGSELFRSFDLSEPVANPPPVTSSAGPRKISLGGNSSIAIAPKGEASSSAAQRTIALQLVDLVPHLPVGLLRATPIDPELRVLFQASELERGMASGRPTVLLRSIFQQAPDLFLSDVEATDTREVVLPFGKVLEQFASFQVRPDQLTNQSVPEVETPFLKMTIEDGKRHGIPPTPIAGRAVSPAIGPAAGPASEEESAMLPVDDPVSPATIRPIRLSLPNGAKMSIAEGAGPAPIRLESSPASSPLAPKKISPNGMGVPATERVPASSGPLIPTPAPSPLAAPPPIRIPFKVTPPSNDLRESARPTKAAAAASRPVPFVFSAEGPRVRLSLRNVLQGISPFQLSGSVEAVPETATIEIPFSILEPQLSLGRVAISPAQFQAALPEEYRSLFKIEETELPVVLPLQEVLQNLPNESLQLRGDQEEVEIAESFETPFSTKAAEDAARMKVATGPIAKAVAVIGDPGDKERDSAAAPENATLPGSPIPATTVPARSALQVAFDTDETLDAKAIVAHASRLPGVSGCAIVFSDGLSLAGNIPPEYEAEALCALAPSIMKRINDQMVGARLGPLNGITLYCAKTPVSFFAHGNICLAALHSVGEIAAEVRARLGCAVRELARMYAQPA